jgi:MoaA/NifB/PqqE/SkfB family radical SAM enzyme
MDISAIWLKSHAHLYPISNYLKTDHIQFEKCGLCGQFHAIKIRAHLRFEKSDWHHNESVHYCFHCQRFSLLEEKSNLTAINARLWSRTPTILNLEPTTRCNFSCWYCIGRTMKQEDIKLDNFIKVLEHFPQLKMLALVGEGEPFLHKGFFEMAKLAKQRGIDVYTISNGSVFSQSVIRKICESGITYISISIDSIDKETFASSRLDGKLDQVLEGIEKLAKYRDEQGYKYPVLGLKGTLFEHTEHDMPDIIREAKKRGIAIFESYQALNLKKSYIDIYPTDKHYLLNSVEQVKQTIQFDSSQQMLPPEERLIPIQRFAEQENISLQNSGNPNGLRNNCDEEWIYSLLSGDITPCCQIKHPFNPQWNLFHYPIQQILENHDYENLRFNLWNGLFLPECDGCSKVGN